jgi:hypothetical protein
MAISPSQGDFILSESPVNKGAIKYKFLYGAVVGHLQKNSGEIG